MNTHSTGGTGMSRYHIGHKTLQKICRAFGFDVEVLGSSTFEAHGERRAIEFRAFLDLMMCSDPWPTNDSGHAQLLGLAHKESTKRGFSDWIDAYHLFEKQK